MTRWTHYHWCTQSVFALHQPRLPHLCEMCVFSTVPEDVHWLPVLHRTLQLHHSGLHVCDSWDAKVFGILFHHLGQGFFWPWNPGGGVGQHFRPQWGTGTGQNELHQCVIRTQVFSDFWCDLHMDMTEVWKMVNCLRDFIFAWKHSRKCC